MKNFLKVAGLALCLMSFLSTPDLRAQQYEVEVILGILDCGASNEDLTIPINGTISVGSGTNAGSAQSDSFSESSALSTSIFLRTFDYLPDYLTLSDVTVISPPEYVCGADFISVTIDLTQNQNNLGTMVEHNISSASGGDNLTLFVSITQIGLSPGTIGDNQTICEYQNPEEIGQLTPASGGIGFTYNWEYSETGSAPWMSIHTDPSNPGSPLVEGQDYTPPRPSQDRWYRRVAVLGAQTAATDPVKISLSNSAEGRYQMDFFLGDYTCSGAPPHIDMNVELEINGVQFNDQGTTSGALISPLFTYEFTEKPTALTIETFGLTEVPGTTCEGHFVQTNLTLSDDQSGSQIEYTLNNNGEELKVFVSLTLVGESVIDPGMIGVGQIICENTIPNGLTETAAAIGATENDNYEWQYSIDDGGTWESISGSNTKDLPFDQQLSVDTWYRRLIFRNCSKGTSDVVEITIADPLVVSIDGLLAEYAVNADDVTLNGTPAGGVFNGPGVVDGIFKPSVAGPGLHTITYTYTNAQGCTGSATQDVLIPAEALCTTIVPKSGDGEFVLDTFSGQIVYRKTEDCTTDIPVSCIATQPDAPVISNVVSASAVTLSDDWDYSSYFQPKDETTLEQANAFETGILGKWRTKTSYVYSTDVIDRDKNYNTGTFDMSVFNWQYDKANQVDKWIPASRVEKYSPNGEALEEYNAIGIASTIKMGYYDHLPYLTAQNATYESVFFESFELTYSSGLVESGSFLHPNADIDETVAHAGSKSLALGPTEGIITPFIQAPNQSGDMLVQLWVKGSLNEQLEVQIQPEGSANTTVQVTEITRSGDWGLYQSVLEIAEGTSFRLKFRYMGTENIWIDDVRVQPVDAEMTCYVYDPATLRLLTIFDGQHFGLYYQYDGEGKLVRKTIETERGMRTLQETFYNVPKVNKEDN